MNRLEIIIPVQEIKSSGVVKNIEHDRLTAIETIIIHTLINEGVENIMCRSEKVMLMCSDGFVHHFDGLVYHCYYKSIPDDILNDLEVTILGYIESSKMIRDISA